jgi:hypothetical protein
MVIITAITPSEKARSLFGLAGPGAISNLHAETSPNFKALLMIADYPPVTIAGGFVSRVWRF